MKKNLLRLTGIVYSIAFFSACNGPERITVKGQAMDEKAGAVVVTENKKYFLDDISSWDDKYKFRQVIVSGEPAEIYNPGQSTDSMVVQEITGPIYLLKKPTWKLVE